MHLQQTKRASRASGGPQYYFHDLSEPVKLYLRDQVSFQLRWLRLTARQSPTSLP